MADSAPLSLPPSLPLSEKKVNPIPIGSKIAELNESSAEIVNRIQNLKQDLQSWRSKLDTQVRVYQNELSELKQSLNVEVNQLRSEFQELRTTLQQQREDVAASLKNLELQDGPVEVNVAEDGKVESNDEKPNDLATDDNVKENAH